MIYSENFSGSYISDEDYRLVRDLDCESIKIPNKIVGASIYTPEFHRFFVLIANHYSNLIGKYEEKKKYCAYVDEVLKDASEEMDETYQALDDALNHPWKNLLLFFRKKLYNLNDWLKGWD